MDQPKGSPGAADALRALHEFLLEDAESAPTADQARARLKAQGVDTASIVKQIRGALAKQKAAEILEAAHSRRDMLVKRIQETPRAESKSGSLKERIQAALASLGSAQQDVYWRKLESVKDADLQALLDDLLTLDELRAEPRDPEKT